MKIRLSASRGSFLLGLATIILSLSGFLWITLHPASYLPAAHSLILLHLVYWIVPVRRARGRTPSHICETSPANES